MMRLLVHPENGNFTHDAMRRVVESLSREEYFSLSYYERWVHVIHRLALETGLLTEDEIAQKLAALRSRASDQ